LSGLKPRRSIPDPELAFVRLGPAAPVT